MFGPACYCLCQHGAIQLTLSRKGAKSQTRGRKRRSTGAKARTSARQVRKPPPDLEQQLESCRRELAEARDQLAEALERQAATSEVLGVISSSPGELEPVFEAMLANAVRICAAKFGTLFRYDGKAFHTAASVGTPPALVEFQKQRGPFQPGPEHPLYRLVRTKQVSHTADGAAASPPNPAVKYGGARSILHVPMLHDEELVAGFLLTELLIPLVMDAIGEPARTRMALWEEQRRAELLP